MERNNTTQLIDQPLPTAHMQALLEQVNGLIPLLTGTPHEHTLHILCESLSELQIMLHTSAQAEAPRWRHDALGMVANATYALQLMCYRDAAPRSTLEPILTVLEALCHQVKLV
jgi:hypothetical protein